MSIAENGSDDLLRPLHDIEDEQGIQLDEVQISRYRPGYPASALYVDFRLPSVMRRRQLTDRVVKQHERVTRSYLGLLISLFDPEQLVVSLMCVILGTASLLNVVVWVATGRIVGSVWGSIFVIVATLAMLRVVSDSFYYEPTASDDFAESRRIDEPSAHRMAAS